MRRTRRPAIPRKARVLASGFVPLDLIVTSRRPLSVRRAVGGTCGNVAIILRRLGFPTTVLAQFGNDPRGEWLRRGLETESVALVDGEIDADRKTGAIVELIAPGLRGKHRFSFQCPECRTDLRHSNLAAPRLVQDHAGRVSEFDVLFFDRATGPLLNLARAARKAGILVVFEPNSLRPGSIAEEAAVLSDVVKYAVKTASPACHEWIPPRGSSTRLLVETLGGEGLRYKRRLRNGKWSVWRYMPSVAAAGVADTAGAGDWCTAGIISVLGTRSSEKFWPPTQVEEALAFGQALAAVSVSFEGPRGVLQHASAASVRRVAANALAARAVSVRAIQRLTKRIGVDVDGDQTEGCPLCLSPIVSEGASPGGFK